jgi:hypothetical protein
MLKKVLSFEGSSGLSETLRVGGGVDKAGADTTELATEGAGEGFSIVDAGADAMGGSPAVVVLDVERPDDRVFLSKGPGQRGVRLHLSDKRRDASWACHGRRRRARRIIGRVEGVDQMWAQPGRMTSGDLRMPSRLSITAPAWHQISS